MLARIFATALLALLSGPTINAAQPVQAAGGANTGSAFERTLSAWHDVGSGAIDTDGFAGLSGGGLGADAAMDGSLRAVCRGSASPGKPCYSSKGLRKRCRVPHTKCALPLKMKRNKLSGELVAVGICRFKPSAESTHICAHPCAPRHQSPC